MLRTNAGLRQVVRNFGTSLLFNGTSSVVHMGIASALNTSGNALTVMGWFKSTTKTDIKMVGNMLGSTNGYGLSLSSTGQLRAEINLTTSGYVSVVSTNSYADGNWHHGAFVYNGSQVQLYVDGAAKGSPTSATGTIKPATSNFVIGKAPWAGAYYMKGFIDDPIVFTSALTAAQISDYYYTGQLPSTPQGRWKFDEGSGTSAIDTGSGGNNGVITDATYSSDVFMVDRTIPTGVHNALDCVSASSQYGSVVDGSWMDGMAQMTVTCWVYSNSASQTAGLVDHDRNNSWNMHLTANKVRGMIAGTFATSSTTLSADTWYHVGFVYNGTNIQTYVAGLADGTATAKTGVVGNGTIGINIGRMHDGFYLSGRIDEIRIWGTALTAGEVLDDKNGVNFKSANLLARYSFNMVKDNGEFYDYSGNGRNGTVINKASIKPGYAHPEDIARTPAY